MVKIAEKALSMHKANPNGSTLTLELLAQAVEKAGKTIADLTGAARGVLSARAQMHRFNDEYQIKDIWSSEESACFQMVGHALRHGLGVPRDALAAKAWLRLSAEMGHAQAQFDLGQLMMTGLLNKEVI